MLRELLELNARFPIAKVAIDGQGQIGVTAQVAFTRLSPEALREAIGAVLNAARVANKLVVGSPPSSTPQLQH
jgi:hypothetical protein